MANFYVQKWTILSLKQCRERIGIKRLKGEAAAQKGAINKSI